LNGGAIAIGHPLGCSGVRILVSLLTVLRENSGDYGVATACNGGGGGSTVVIKRT